MVPQRIIKTLAVRDELNRHQTRADYSIWHILTLYITNEVVYVFIFHHVYYIRMYVSGNFFFFAFFLSFFLYSDVKIH